MQLDLHPQKINPKRNPQDFLSRCFFTQGDLISKKIILLKMIDLNNFAETFINKLSLLTSTAWRWVYQPAVPVQCYWALLILSQLAGDLCNENMSHNIQELCRKSRKVIKMSRNNWNWKCLFMKNIESSKIEWKTNRQSWWFGLKRGKKSKKSTHQYLSLSILGKFISFSIPLLDQSIGAVVISHIGLVQNFCCFTGPPQLFQIDRFK